MGEKVSVHRILASEVGKPKASDIIAALAFNGFAIVPLKPTEAMIAAGWIDKEDVNPDDIWHAMVRASEETAGF